MTGFVTRNIDPTEYALVREIHTAHRVHEIGPNREGFCWSLVVYADSVNFVDAATGRWTWIDSDAVTGFSIATYDEQTALLDEYGRGVVSKMSDQALELFHLWWEGPETYAYVGEPDAEGFEPSLFYADHSGGAEILAHNLDVLTRVLGRPATKNEVQVLTEAVTPYLAALKVWGDWDEFDVLMEDEFKRRKSSAGNPEKEN